MLATLLALALRLFPLSRPGYLSGDTQYDDGVYFGNALRLVHGVIAYRDFAMVQPPGSMLLMAPIALVAKVAGTAWGLAAARLATAVADAANVTLIGLLVRHRGSLAVTLACAGYAIYPAALIASQTLLLEPWLNLFCLLGALLVFPPGRRAGSRRLAWGGACFGFAAAIKIWAFAPALLAGVTGGAGGPSRRGRAWFAAGFAAGLAVPCLPFLALAPSGFGRTVFVSELVQSTHGRFGPKLRLADITGQDVAASRAVLAADTRVWQAAFSRARYVWLIGSGGNTSPRIAWTWSLYGYFDQHFRLLRFASSFRGKGDVPRGGLYGRA